MNIHEFQAKQLLAGFGVPVPAGRVVASAEEAREAARVLLAGGAPSIVVKSQIHGGGRGKGSFKSGFQGGVRVCATAEEAGCCAEGMLGQVLVTRQTGAEGRRVHRVLVEAGCPVAKEHYLAVMLDRAAGRPVVIASAEGGMGIEEVAGRTPERIVKERVDPAMGFQGYQARKIAVSMGWRGELVQAGAQLLVSVYRAWWECDATLIEVNPLGRMEDGKGRESLVVMDAKVDLDDNSLYRHPEFAALRDEAGESPLETQATRHGLSYIKLEGNIACLVNGAGLAMATMDILKHYGGSPANFLDVGGGASQKQVTEAFGIILQDPNVCGILVNIFGGIMDCDVIARGVVTAAKESGSRLPLVVRLEGNNVAAGRRTLAASKLTLTAAETMADAAQKVIAAVGA